MYNNNNRGGNLYQNQNPNYRQNIYQNFNRPQSNYQNNYNPGNYNQNNNYQNNNYQNYNNNQNQNPNNGPQIFISGKIGRLLISSETLEQFSNSLKSAEWTTNPNYLQAKNVEVKMKSNSLQGQMQSEIRIPRNRFNEYGLQANFNVGEFFNYINLVKEENKRFNDKIENEKNDFVRNNFPNEKPDIRMDDLYVKIGQNRKDVLMKDSYLYGKLERIFPYIKPYEAPKNADMGAPGGAMFNKDDKDEKIFTNTPGF